jgi:hypothetical protein
MMGYMKRRLLTILLAAMTLALPLCSALAAADDEGVRPNVKLEGYPRVVKSEDSSTALTYILLIFIAGVCVAIMFKDAKRTHLD